MLIIKSSALLLSFFFPLHCICNHSLPTSPNTFFKKNVIVIMYYSDHIRVYQQNTWFAHFLVDNKKADGNSLTRVLQIKMEASKYGYFIKLFWQIILWDHQFPPLVSIYWITLLTKSFTHTYNLSLLRAGWYENWEIFILDFVCQFIILQIEPLSLSEHNILNLSNHLPNLCGINIIELEIYVITPIDHPLQWL